MLSRRTYLLSSLAALVSPTPSIAMPVAPIKLAPISIEVGASDTSCTLDINDNAFIFGSFVAPTKGWLAVGLNSSAELSGTRFLMAALETGNTIRAEERIANPPQHSPIKALNAAPVFELRALQPVDGGTKIHFTARRTVPEPHPCDFTPGTELGLMFAFSHETNFRHHSAWRKHFTITV